MLAVRPQAMIRKPYAIARREQQEDRTIKYRIVYEDKKGESLEKIEALGLDQELVQEIERHFDTEEKMLFRNNENLNQQNAPQVLVAPFFFPDTQNPIFTLQHKGKRATNRDKTRKAGGDIDPNKLRYGDIEEADKPLEIKKVRKVGENKNGKVLLEFWVSWMQRTNGEQPLDSLVTNIQLRKHNPELLIEFYENQLKFLRDGRAQQNKKPEGDTNQISRGLPEPASSKKRELIGQQGKEYLQSLLAPKQPDSRTQPQTQTADPLGFGGQVKLSSGQSHLYGQAAQPATVIYDDKPFATDSQGQRAVNNQSLKDNFVQGAGPVKNYLEGSEEETD